MGHEARARQDYGHARQIAIFAALNENNLLLADQAKRLLDLALEALDTREPLPQASLQDLWNKSAKLEGYLVSHRAQLEAFRAAVAQLQQREVV